MPAVMSIDDSESLIVKTLNCVGYIKNTKIVDTLQGSIWRSVQQSSNRRVVIKVTNRHLHKHRMIMVDQCAVNVHENIEKETLILAQLSNDKQCPNSVTKYVDSFKSNRYYMLVMEDGGRSLFDFVLKAHRFIDAGHLDITEWHNLVKIIFKQMLECIEYLHSKRVCHYDISLENFLINDVDIAVNHDDKIQFCADSIQIKLCDFGLAELFPPNARHFASNKYCGKRNYKSPEITSLQRTFCAKSNDLFCLGVCLFMMLIGTAPWKETATEDERFVHIMKGGMVRLLSSWNRLHYANRDIIDLFSLLFQYEKQRVNMDKLKECQWLVAA